jgi:hypothetical protein
MSRLELHGRSIRLAPERRAAYVGQARLGSSRKGRELPRDVSLLHLVVAGEQKAVVAGQELAGAC